jgi:hypothetical protein
MEARWERNRTRRVGRIGKARQARLELLDEEPLSQPSTRSGWTAFALDGRPALGAVASFYRPVRPVSPLTGRTFLRRQLGANGGAQRLERFEHEHPSHEAFQERHRHAAEKVRRLRAAQMPLVDAMLDEAIEQPP